MFFHSIILLSNSIFPPHETDIDQSTAEAGCHAKRWPAPGKSAVVLLCPETFIVIYIIWGRGWRNSTYFCTAHCTAWYVHERNESKVLESFLRWIRHRLLRRWDEMSEYGRIQVAGIQRCGVKADISSALKNVDKLKISKWHQMTYHHLFRQNQAFVFSPRFTIDSPHATPAGINFLFPSLWCSEITWQRN